VKKPSVQLTIQRRSGATVADKPMWRQSLQELLPSHSPLLHARFSVLSIVTYVYDSVVY